MAITKEINIVVNSEGAEEKVKSLSKEIDNVGSSSEKSMDKYAGAIKKSNPAVEKLNQLTGGVSNSLLDVSESAKKAGTSMRSAFIASGVGLLVAALGFVVEHWEDISDLIDGTNKKLENQLALNRSNAEVLESEIGLLDKQINLQTKQGKGNELLQEQKKALVKQAQELNKEEIKILEQQLVRLKATQEELSLWEKIKGAALTTFLGAEGAAMATASLASGRTEAINELEQAILKAKGEAIDLETVLFDIENPEQKKSKKDRKEKTDKGAKIKFDDSAQKRIDDEIKAIEEIARIRQEFADKNRENELVQSEVDRERKIMEIEQLVADEVFKREAIAEVNKYYDEQAAEIEAKRIEESLEAERIATEKKMKLQDEAIQHQKDGINSVKQLTSDVFEIFDNLGKSDSKKKEKRAKTQFEVQKQLNLALATVDGFKAVTSSLSQSPIAIGPVPNPAGIASLAFAIGSSAINIAKIASSKYKGGSSGGGGGGSSDASAAIAKAPSFNLVQGTGSNQIADSIQGGNQPIKAYVVSSDVSSSQEMDRNIESNATL